MKPGQLIVVTGPVASGKSAVIKAQARAALALGDVAIYDGDTTPVNSIKRDLKEGKTVIVETRDHPSAVGRFLTCKIDLLIRVEKPK